MIRHILAFLISPLIGLTSCIAYAFLTDWIETDIIRPYWGLPALEDDFPFGGGLALFFALSIFAAYFLTFIIVYPSVSLLTRAQRDNFKYIVLTGLAVGIVLGMGLELLIKQPGEAIWDWAWPISYPIVGSLGAYISYWLIAIKSKGRKKRRP